MAASVVGYLQSSAVKDAGNAYFIALPGNGQQPGDVLLLWTFFDNTGLSTPSVTSLRTTPGETNSWIRLAKVNSQTSSAGGGVIAELWAIQTTVAWDANYNYVIMDVGVSARGAICLVARGVDLASAVAATGTSTATASVPSGGLVVGCATWQSNAAGTGDTDTTGGAWQGTESVATTGKGASTNVAGLVQYKLPSAAGNQTYNASTAAYNTAVVALPAVAPPSTAPTVTATFGTGGNEWLDLSWGALAGIKDYVVYRDGVVVVPSTGDVVSYRASLPLSDPGVQHGWTVAAKNLAGAGPQSAVKTGTVGVGLPSWSLSAVLIGSLDVQWSNKVYPVRYEIHGCTEAAYLANGESALQYLFTTPVQGTTGGGSWRHTGLTPGERWTYRVITVAQQIDSPNAAGRQLSYNFCYTATADKTAAAATNNTATLLPKATLFASSAVQPNGGYLRNYDVTDPANWVQLPDGNYHLIVDDGWGASGNDLVSALTQQSGGNVGFYVDLGDLPEGMVPAGPVTIGAWLTYYHGNTNDFSSVFVSSDPDGWDDDFVRPAYDGTYGRKEVIQDGDFAFVSFPGGIYPGGRTTPFGFVESEGVFAAPAKSGDAGFTYIYDTWNNPPHTEPVWDSALSQYTRGESQAIEVTYLSGDGTLQLYVQVESESGGADSGDFYMAEITAGSCRWLQRAGGTTAGPGVVTVLNTTSGHGLAAGDVVYAEVDDNALTLKINGVTQLTATGSRGLNGYSGAFIKRDAGVGHPVGATLRLSRVAFYPVARASEFGVASNSSYKLDLPTTYQTVTGWFETTVAAPRLRSGHNWWMTGYALTNRNSPPPYQQFDMASFAVRVPFCAPLLAPPNFAASTGEVNTIYLCWDAQADAKSYRIYQNELFYAEVPVESLTTYQGQQAYALVGSYGNNGTIPIDPTNKWHVRALTGGGAPSPITAQVSGSAIPPAPEQGYALTQPNGVILGCTRPYNDSTKSLNMRVYRDGTLIQETAANLYYYLDTGVPLWGTADYQLAFYDPIAGAEGPLSPVLTVQRTTCALAKPTSDVSNQGGGNNPVNGTIGTTYTRVDGPFGQTDNDGTFQIGTASDSSAQMTFGMSPVDVPIPAGSTIVETYVGGFGLVSPSTSFTGGYVTCTLQNGSGGALTAETREWSQTIVPTGVRWRPVLWRFDGPANLPLDLVFRVQAKAVVPVTSFNPGSLQTLVIYDDPNNQPPTGGGAPAFAAFGIPL